MIRTAKSLESKCLHYVPRWTSTRCTCGNVSIGTKTTYVFMQETWFYILRWDGQTFPFQENRFLFIGLEDDDDDQCDQKKLANVYKSCPKMISLKKWLILTPLQKLPKNRGDLGKLITAKGFKKLFKVQ